ncbi:MAG: Tex family protein [Syntrophorhabdaceae bacterium]|nr:RNA-binding transcriptional accessory protein [Syntrophorhabdaceae bacterium]MDD4197436.1 Tex family protein [Syntrophorhabdaceae bacterium]
MNIHHINKIAVELSIAPDRVKATAALLSEGATVPFIARYRKEVTGSLDEVAITAVRDRLEQLDELDKRRDSILSSLDERGLLTDELKDQLEKAKTLTVLEDLYLPFRPKRRTRATIAKEKGLELLARCLFEVLPGFDPMQKVLEFVDSEKGVRSAEDALAGARDIIAEWVSEDADARAALREMLLTRGKITSRVVTGKEEEGTKFNDYYAWEEPVKAAPSHRILALRRGEREGFLILHITGCDDEALRWLKTHFIKKDTPAPGQVELAVTDSYDRLLLPSLETDVRLALKTRADEEAIKVFADNLRQLLLASPLGEKSVMAIDPGFRTGCKVACLDRQGKLLRFETIYPHSSEKQSAEAGRTIIELCEACAVDAIAVGNGTAGRETEAFLKGLQLPDRIPVVSVNESGASIYSASDVAREEFPDHDVTARGAVSIGRRLMDPLAELVKIDPKSIGVGQYQHDVNQVALKKGLDDVVMSCVNGVGVELNTASPQLLSYVSGLGASLAKNIVSYRIENGPFKTRQDLKKVPRLGPRAFEQAAGFLRIRGSSEPLDASAVHPERYSLVEAMAKDAGCTVKDLMADEALRKKIDLSHYVSGTVGMPTLTDIMNELARPGRDPREQFQTFVFTEGIEKIEDLKRGMKLCGIVTNVTAFGAFIDIGVHQDGLVHISQLANKFVKNPADVVKVHQHVTVTVLSVDLARKRIGLSMK